MMLGHMWRPRRLLLRNRKMHVSNSLEATALGRLCVCLDIWDADALRWSCLSFDFVQRWPILELRYGLLVGADTGAHVGNL